jgi:hypothetical protein
MPVKFGFAGEGQALAPDAAASEWKNRGEASTGNGWRPSLAAGQIRHRLGGADDDHHLPAGSRPLAVSLQRRNFFVPSVRAPAGIELASCVTSPNPRRQIREEVIGFDIHLVSRRCTIEFATCWKTD